jgi:CBS domain-containing protein
MNRTVRDVMTRTVVVVPVSGTCKEMAGLMNKYRVSALPVVDEDGRIRGIVSEADLLLKEDPDLQAEQPLIQRRRHRAERAKAAGLTAGDVMTAPVYTVGADDTVVEAARTMHDRGVKRLPVVDENGHVLGILSRADLIKLLLRADDEIALEIRRDLLSRALSIDPREVRVQVCDGVVHLEGELENESLVGILIELVRRVEGVIGVESRLSWRKDDTAPPPRFPWATGVGLTH